MITLYYCEECGSIDFALTSSADMDCCECGHGQMIRQTADSIEDLFRVSFQRIAEKCHQNSVNHGFWEEERNDGEMIALCHSELSEALEAIRHGNPPSEHIPEYSGAEEEYADLLIRVMDGMIGRGYRIPQAVIAKMSFNAGRPYKHRKEF